MKRIFPLSLVLLASFAAYGVGNGDDTQEVVSAPGSPRTLYRKRIGDLQEQIQQSTASINQFGTISSDPVKAKLYIASIAVKLQLEEKLFETELRFSKYEKKVEEKFLKRAYALGALALSSDAADEK